MRHAHVAQIAQHLRGFGKIAAIHRVADTIIKIVFDRDDTFYFDMQRGSASIFKCHAFQRTKVYQAPFDVMLARRFNRADVLGVTMPNDDKIIRIETVQNSAYKQEKSYLQLEFTGKYTNAIILDEGMKVLEALRHIDASVSTRTVRLGEVLRDPPPPPYTPKPDPIPDVEAFLYEVHAQNEAQRLAALKRQKITQLEKKLRRLERRFETLEDETELYAEAERLQHLGHLLLANIDKVRPYEREVRLNDFDGTPVCAELPQAYPSASAMAQSFFRRSKKARQKAAHMHIESKSLREKIDYQKLFIRNVAEAANVASLMMLFPERAREKKRTQSESVETFWVDGYKVELGKNEKGNVELLAKARARDIWLHLKDRPSTHVIIRTDKQSVPENVLETAAKLCVDFSVFEKGRYLVDYTPRREVKIQEGANVLYNNYKTILVDKG